MQDKYFKKKKKTHNKYKKINKNKNKNKPHNFTVFILMVNYIALI